jgi:hypothetical protein
VSGIITRSAAGRSAPVRPGAQVDLVIDRSDGVINLCEMKYAAQEYAITQAVEDDLRRKRAAFVAETGTKRAVHLTLVTPYGLAHNRHRSVAQSEVTAEDLFRP